jgi:ABC-type glycerol-3-phosphate transport system substrate-binding protein
MQAGQPTTLLNGWLWVITTANADRKMMAAAFLEWMMEAGGQADYTEAIHMLPSQRAAMRQLDINPLYVDFVTQLLGNAILLPPEIGSSPTARAMQNALAAVLSGQRSAEQAAQDVLNQLSG